MRAYKCVCKQPLISVTVIKEVPIKLGLATLSTSYAKAQNLARFVGLSIPCFSTVMSFIKCSNSYTRLISSG